MEEEEEGGGAPEGAPAWMATFADMSTLLLTFFVLLLSFANMDVQSFRMALGSVRDALGVDSPQRGQFEGVTTNPVAFEMDKVGSGFLGEEQAIMAVKALLKRKDLKNKINVIMTNRHIRLSISGLFEPGSATLGPKSFKELDVIADVCRTNLMPIRVEAHTDNKPIRSAQFPSNWELSSMRAGAVARYLAEAGQVEGKRLNPGGMASTRPTNDNSTPELRAKNRRVEVILMRKTKHKIFDSNAAEWESAPDVHPTGR